MKLHVRSFAGEITLDVLPKQTILEIKQMIHRVDPLFSVWKQRLVDPADHEIRFYDNQTVRQLGWRREKLLFLVVVEKYHVATLDKIVRIMDIPSNQPMPPSYALMEPLPYEVRLGLERGREYIFPLRVLNNGGLSITRGRVTLMTTFFNTIHENPREKKYTFRSEIDIRATFNKMVIANYSSSHETQFYCMELILSPPFSFHIYSDNPQEIIEFENAISQYDKDIRIIYLNLKPPQRSYSGSKHKRSSKRSVRDYIRRSIKKELRKLMK